MSKINKIITNKPVTLTQEEVANLSETLSAVRTAGGGGGGATYSGDGRYIEITGNNTITLTTTAANQLDRVIPTKVSDLTDSANYATVESLTAYQVAGDYLSANALNSLSGTWETVTAKLDTTAAAQTYLDKTTYATDSATFVTSSSNTITGTKQYALTTAGWTEVSTPTIPAITAESGISADGYKIGLTTTAINAITSVSSKVDKPSSLVDKYLVLRTDSNGDVSGWCDFQDQSYSKSEALGTFVATANIDTTTLSGDGKSISTKLGVKTDVIATRDYVNSSFLPTSGGTVSGQLVVSGDGNFDQENLKFIRSGLNGYGRIGLASNGALAFKVDDSNSNTTQINVAANASYNELIQVQHSGTTAYLIPAVTATTTAGLTNDGILHIILESE